METGMIRLRYVVLALLASLFIGAGALAANTQRSFVSPEEAAQALVDAIQAHDRAATLGVLGQDAAAWISSGDTVADQTAIAHFIAAYDARHQLVQKDGKATLTLGADAFPFAFPIVRKGERWRFDTTAGKLEMLARRIGENELSAINVLQAIVDAQLEYASVDRDGDGVMAYARKFLSSPGKHDGLYWPVDPGQAPSPAGELLAKASSEGYQAQGQAKGKQPYHGYYYRPLTRQGKHASSGALDYVVGGRAIGGFAVVAYPARYGNSGIMTFIVNQDGKIYESDLGPTTQAKALKMNGYDPGPGWTPVDAGTQARK
jgi:hypothetical protein